MRPDVGHASGEANAEVGDRLSRRHSGAVRGQLEMAGPGGLVKPGIRTVDRLPANTMGFLAHGDATVVKVEVEIVVLIPPVRTDTVIARRPDMQEVVSRDGVLDDPIAD